MSSGKGWVKWLDAQSAGVFVEARGIHECHGPEAAHVAVVKCASIVEGELHRRVLAQLRRKRAVVDQESARKPRLHDEPIAGGEVQHDQLRTAPRSFDCDACGALGELAR